MDETLPITFPLPSESAIASYNYSDIAEGTGIKLFYAAYTSAASILTENQIYSHTIDTRATSASPPTDAYQLLSDIDFDLSAFNTPKVVKGTCYINGLFSVYTQGTGANGTGKLSLKLRKWDGTTETEIASTDLEVSTGHNTTVTKLYCISIPVTTPQNFKKGDILRLTVLTYYKKTEVGTGGGDGSCTIGHDPMNRNGTYIAPSTDVPTSITQLKAWVPFKLDL